MPESDNPGSDNPESDNTVKLTAASARRIALAAQGFSDPRPKAIADVRHFRRALQRMSVLQLDSVNVLARSHYLPMWSRLGPYDRDKLDQWLWTSRENVEFLGHEASITPVATEPLLRWRARGRWRMGEELEAEHPDYVERVRQQVTDRGPLSVKQLDDAGDRQGPWWGHKPGKAALERLYVTGRLGIDHRDRQFTTHYDLPERIIPDDVRAAPTPSDDDALRELLRQGARSHGVGTAADLADYFRIRMPRARPLLAELVAEGELIAAEVEGWDDAAYVWPGTPRPRSIDAATMLSPFDPVVWFRPRAERLFDFEYRIEIYVPEAKRRWGYYVLPFLLGDRLVARCCLKADRANRQLLVRSAFGEADIDPTDVAGPLLEALQSLGDWLGLERGLVVHPVGDLASTLTKG